MGEITAKFKDAYWVDKDHTAFSVEVMLSNGEIYPFTYAVDGHDDNDSIVSQLVKRNYHAGVIKINDDSSKYIVNNGIVDNSYKIREDRNMLLYLTDVFVSIPDYPITDEHREEVKQFRQQLRDITKQKGFPDSVVWPVLPNCIKDKVNMPL